VAFEDSGQERTEQPTGKRREEARRQGRIAVSADLTAAAAMLSALGVASMNGPALARDLVDVVQHGLAGLPRAPLGPDQVVALVADATGTMVRAAAPLLAVPAAAAVAAGLAQTRVAFSIRLLVPTWDRMSPAAHLRRLLGAHALETLGKAAAKLGIAGGLGTLAVRDAWPELIAARPDLAARSAAIAEVVGRVAWRIALAWLCLAALDWGWQWWRQERRLRMTRDELRRETKETEGSPTLRARLRSVHRRMATRRIMAEVARADVVVRNPTHVAVALAYRAATMHAPRVLAKGERLLALRMIEVAQRAGIPVVENRPLARALFAAVAVGREIPRDLYRGVAEVLAYVYALRGRPA
jgi:flagellar biosynthetic protein FlhB